MKKIVSIPLIIAGSIIAFIATVIIIIIIKVLIWPTPIANYKAGNNNYSLEIIQNGEPRGLATQSTSCTLKLKNGLFTVCTTTATLHDIGGAEEDYFLVEWNEDYVRVIVMHGGSGMDRNQLPYTGDEGYRLYYNGQVTYSNYIIDDLSGTYYEIIGSSKLIIDGDSVTKITV